MQRIGRDLSVRTKKTDAQENISDFTFKCNEGKLKMEASP